MNKQAKLNAIDAQIEKYATAFEQAENALRAHCIDGDSVLSSNSVTPRRLSNTEVSMHIKAMIFARYENARLVKERFQIQFGRSYEWVDQLLNTMEVIWATYVTKGVIVNAHKITEIHFLAYRMEEAFDNSSKAA